MDLKGASLNGYGIEFLNKAVDLSLIPITHSKLLIYSSSSAFSTPLKITSFIAISSGVENWGGVKI